MLNKAKLSMGSNSPVILRAADTTAIAEGTKTENYYCSLSAALRLMGGLCPHRKLGLFNMIFTRLLTREFFLQCTL